jgi:hypothetical protein
VNCIGLKELTTTDHGITLFSAIQNNNGVMEMFRLPINLYKYVHETFLQLFSQPDNYIAEPNDTFRHRGGYRKTTHHTWNFVCKDMSGYGIFKSRQTGIERRFKIGGLNMSLPAKRHFGLA